MKRENYKYSVQTGIDSSGLPTYAQFDGYFVEYYKEKWQPVFECRVEKLDPQTIKRLEKSLDFASWLLNKRFKDFKQLIKSKLGLC